MSRPPISPIPRCRRPRFAHRAPKRCFFSTLHGCAVRRVDVCRLLVGCDHPSRRCLPVVLAEHDVAAQDMGLWFRVEAPMTRWLGRRVVTPTFHDANSTLSAWRRLQPLRRIHGRPTLDQWMHRLFCEWPVHLETFLDIVEEAGKGFRGLWESRLAALEE